MSRKRKLGADVTSTPLSAVAAARALRQKSNFSVKGTESPGSGNHLGPQTTNSQNENRTGSEIRDGSKSFAQSRSGSHMLPNPLLSSSALFNPADAPTSFTIVDESYVEDMDTARSEFESLNEPNIKFETTCRLEPVELRTLQPSRGFGARDAYFTDTKQEITLSTGDHFYILGQYLLSVKRGAVSTYGALLTPASNSVLVNALPTHSLPAVYFVASPADTAVILLEPFHRLEEGVGRITNGKRSRPQLSSKIRGEKVDESADLVSRELNFHNECAPSPQCLAYWNSSFYPGPEYIEEFRSGRSSFDGLDIPDNWVQVLKHEIHSEDYHAAGQKILISGARGSGEAVLTKYVVNTLLTTPWSNLQSTEPSHNTVYVLDLDAERPEFSTSGQVSLIAVRQPVIGPPYVHVAAKASTHEILWAHHSMPTDLETYGERFISITQDLLRRAVGLRPLVVRLPPYKLPCSHELHQQLSYRAEPTLILRLEAESPELTRATRHFDGRVIYLSSIDDDAKRFTVVETCKSLSEQQDMQAASYLHHRVLSMSQTIAWDQANICSFPTYTFTYARGFKNFKAVYFQDTTPPRSNNAIFKRLDAMLVHIIVATDRKTLRDYHLLRGVGDKIPYFGPKPDGTYWPLDPSGTRVVGTGIIREFALHLQEFRMIMPPSVDQALADVDCSSIIIGVGCFTQPDFALAEWRPEPGSQAAEISVPYRDSREIPAARRL